MPLITKDDVSRLRADWQRASKRNSCRVRKDPVLGYVLFDPMDKMSAYRLTPWGEPLWITLKAFKLRQKLGLPKPRKRKIKPKMPESDFSLGEIELAQEIMEKLS